jgi:antitoxin HigA-1
MALVMHASLAVHPGEWLKSEVIDAQGIAIGALANAIGVSRQTVSSLLNGRTALSADTAIRFEKLFGIKVEAQRLGAAIVSKICCNAARKACVSTSVNPVHARLLTPAAM